MLGYYRRQNQYIIAQHSQSHPNCATVLKINYFYTYYIHIHITHIQKLVTQINFVNTFTIALALNFNVVTSYYLLYQTNHQTYLKMMLICH